METLHFFTTLKFSWLNSWIPTVFLLIIQFIFMGIYKEGGKRAVDTSWYDKKAKNYAVFNTVMQFVVIILGFFVPFKCCTFWFWIGMVIYLIAFVCFIWSFYSYGTADIGKVITKGIYKHSRNPMYATFNLGMIGVCVATASLWLLIATLVFAWATHLVVLCEEKYCEKTYGESYLKYKQSVARYFGI